MRSLKILITAWLCFTLLPVQAQSYRLGLSSSLGIYPDPSSTHILLNGLIEFKLSDFYAIQPEVGIGGFFDHPGSSLVFDFSVFGKFYPIRDRFFLEMGPSALFLTGKQKNTGIGFLFGVGYEFSDYLYGSLRSGHYSDGLGSPLFMTVGYKF